MLFINKSIQKFTNMIIKVISISIFTVAFVILVIPLTVMGELQEYLLRKNIDTTSSDNTIIVKRKQLKEATGGGKGKGKGKGSRKEPSSQPTEKFDLSKCELYANLWILDLTESCIGDPLENNFLGCQCTDAEYRIDLGQIDCGQHLCPEDCEVCKTCLYYVIDDCVKAEPITYTEGPSSSPLSI